MILDYWGQPVTRAGRDEAYFEAMKTTVDACLPGLKASFERSNEMLELFRTPRVLGPFGDPLSRADAGMAPVPAMNGGKSITVPLHYPPRNLSVPITLERE